MMLLSRPRLIAASLCILLVLAAGLLLSLGRFGPLMHSRAAENLRLFDVQEEPPVQHEPMPADAAAFAPPAPEEPSPP